MTHIDDLPPANVAVTGSCFCHFVGAGWIADLAHAWVPTVNVT